MGFLGCFFLATMLLIYRRGRGVLESGKASKPEEPAGKPQTVREYHRAHEAEIRPHVRRGLLTFFSGSNDYNCNCLKIYNKDMKS